MLRIRSSQMSALRQASLARAEKRISDGLWQAHPDRCRELWPEDSRGERRTAFVRAGIRAAERYDIRGEREVRLFVSLQLHHGASFEQTRACAWMKPILCDAKLDGARKMELIAVQLADDSRRRSEVEGHLV